MIHSYEEMKTDLRESVEKLAAFLGHGLDKETVEQCTFGAMEKAVNKSWTDKFQKETDARFTQNGAAGDWRNHFREDQSARMDMLVAEKMAGTGLEYDYEQYQCRV